ncbi:MAG: GHKL domain-containing protein [Lachnospiraceae bacterium]|nr:GHKL domain-containing protein [Lachnospiraceae bacterium]
MTEQVSVEFFDTFMNITLEVFFAATAVLYVYWTKPFVRNKRAVYYAAFLYWLIGLIGRYTDAPVWVGRIMAIVGFLLPCLILFLLDDRRNPLQKVFICTVFSLIWWIMLEMLSELGFYERDIVFSFEKMRSSVTVAVIEFVVYNVLFYGIATVILFFSFRLLHKKYRRKSEELTWREFVMLLAPTGTFLVVKPIIRSYFYLWMDGIENGSIEENIPGDPYRIGFCILSYASILVIIIFYQQIRDRQEEEYARRALESQTEDIHRHMEQIEDTYEKMRAMRHDMGNHMAVIQGLIESGERREASEYIGRWQKNLEELAPRVRTGNPFTDAALSGFADRFAEAGIPFEDSFIFPAKLAIDPFDMCVVLSNALQNAYEASVCIDDPTVSVTSVVRGTTFILNVKNRTAGSVSDLTEDGIPYSGKTQDGHGYGLKNIRNIALKYNGEIEIRQEEGSNGSEFILNVMMIGSHQ